MEFCLMSYGGREAEVANSFEDVRRGSESF